MTKPSAKFYRDQLLDLGNFIMHEFPDEITQGGSAEVAKEIMLTLRARIDAMMGRGGAGMSEERKLWAGEHWPCFECEHLQTADDGDRVDEWCALPESPFGHCHPDWHNTREDGPYWDCPYREEAQP